MGGEGQSGADAGFHIVDASDGDRLPDVRLLFEEYAASLGFDLSFQDFARELAVLPGEYAPPRGRLLVAVGRAEEPLGCVGLRALADDACELKRLYVRPAARGRGVGRALAGAAVDAARAAGYRAIRLDTVPSMSEGRALYRSLGFREIEPYRFNPVAGTTFMELRL